MNLSFFISNRYFFSKKKKNFINIIAIISMLVVSIGTAALIIALSVFNGMEDLLRSIHSEFDAPLQIIPKEGKSFVLDAKLKNEILSIKGITDIIEVVEDKALLKYNNSQMIVSVKGVSQNFIENERMKGAIREGEYRFDYGEINKAIIGRGILYKMGISLRNEFYPLQLNYPKNVRPGTLDPSKYLQRANILTGGVFALEQHYDDNYIFVPIEFTETLFDYKGKRSALEILINDPRNVTSIQKSLVNKIGNDFNVLNADQQHESIYKILKIEKLFIFITFSLIVGIASINIFFSLSMLVTEKLPDISMLKSMGATDRLIAQIFLSEGAIIAFLGAGSGLALGFLVAWGQQTYGLITMGVQSAVMAAYPVKIIGSDFLFTAICIICITIVAAIQPAYRASKQSTLNIK
ncbi:MAG: ABC transporter permease [Reichenbachiella sp.]